MKKKNCCLAFVISALTILCISCTAQTEAQKNVNQTSSQSAAQAQMSNGDSAVKSEIDTSNWKTYKDTRNGYSFRYPPNLILQQKKKVRLYHFINFKHQDPCEGGDDSPVLKTLIDFDATFKVANKNFQSYKWEEYDRDAEIKLGKLNRAVEGKIVSHGSNGCGYDEYVYPFQKERSFIMDYQIIGLFSVINSALPEAKEVLKHPNLLKNEDEIIKKILESFEYIKN